MSTKKFGKNEEVSIFAKNLRKLLDSRSIKYRDFARQVKIRRPSYLSDLLSGRANPSTRLVEDIAEALGVSAENLIAGDVSETEGEYFSAKEILKAKARVGFNEYIEAADLDQLNFLIEYIALLQKQITRPPSPPGRGDEGPFQHVDPNDDPADFELARRGP